MSGMPLTLEERYLIHAGFVAGLSLAEIAKQLGRHRSVIYDERYRGLTGAGNYCPHRAQLHRDAAVARSAANSRRKPAAEWRKVERKFKAGCYLVGLQAAPVLEYSFLDASKNLGSR